MRKLFLVPLFLGIVALTMGQPLLIEDFDYTAGDQLINADDWFLQQTNTNDPILVSDGGLSYLGYIGSGIGNAAIVGPTNQDLFRGFTKTSDGSLYLSCLVNVTSANEAPEYFLTFKESSTSATNTNYRGRIFAKRDASDNLSFGVAKGTGGDIYTDFVYSLNTTYLVVMKYTFNPDAGDDVVELFINPVPGEPEPASNLSTTDSNSEMGMGSVLLRQGSGGPTVIVDGIRVATTWEEAVAAEEPSGLFISEVADPGDVANSKFVELFNPTESEIDLTALNIYFVRQANGGSYASFQITGTIAAGQTFVVANNATDFVAQFGFEANMYNSSVVSGNGDDAYMLFVGGNQTDGTLYDIYGVIDEDGTGKPWEYMDGRAYRKGGITSPNTTWTASEWEISSAIAANCTPGTHDASVVIDNDPPVWEATYPKAANVEDVQFDLLAQLDETSTVYYVVLDDGATAPTVGEVTAGTGSAGATAVAAGSFTAGTSETTETVTGLTVETSYDVYVVAEDDEATPNVQDAVSLVEITTVVMPDVLLKADFETDLSPFTAVSIVGDQDWYKATYSGNSYANISGYSGGAQDNDDYLISPAIDLDGTTDNEFSFVTAKNYSGPDLQVLISTDFSGTYDATAVGAATWTDISASFSYSGGSFAWVESGSFDLSAYSGTVYIAFRYLSSTADGAAQWEVDDFMLTGFLLAGSDATLSDLLVAGTSVTGFEVAKYNYKYELPAGTTTAPAVTYTTTDDNASAVVTPATDLAGDAAARTTTVDVTAQDGTTTLTYSIVFNPVLEVANLGELRASADESRKYIVTGEVLLSFQQSFRNKKYVQDGTGGVEIDDNPGTITTTYSIGDGITGLEGTVEEYNGMLQFHPTTDPGAASSTGNTLNPLIVTPAQIKANLDTYESILVTVAEATISEADGTVEFANGSNYTLNGETESMVLRVSFYNTTLTGVIIPDSANVTGIVMDYNGTAQISPRSSDDVVELIEYIPSTDATLSSLEYNGTAVDGFSAAQLSYFVTLAQGTTEVPAVTATTTDENATVNIIDATDLAGDAAARTTTVEVTAEDGETMKTYTIEFTVAVSAKDALFSSVRAYPIPAVNTLYLENAADIRTMTVFDITGSVVLQKHNAGDDKVQVDVSSLDSGVYMIRMSNEGSTGIVRFVKQ